MATRALMGGVVSAAVTVKQEGFAGQKANLEVFESGKLIEPNDPQWERLQALSRQAKSDPAAWLTMGDVYGNTAQSPVFQAAFAKWLGALWRQGTAATLTQYVSGKPA